MMPMRIKRLVAIGSLVLVGVLGTGWWQIRQFGRVTPPHIVLSGMHPDVEIELRAAEQAILNEPDSSILWGEYGMSLLAHQRMQEAIICFREASRINPRDPKWPYYLGVILVETDYSAARGEWERCLQLEPSYLPTRHRLLTLFIQQNELELAHHLLKESRELSPNDLRLLLLASRLALLNNNIEEASHALQSSRELYPQVREPYVESAKLERRRGHRELAEKYAVMGEKLPPASVDDPWYSEVILLDASSRNESMRADQFVQAGHFAEAAQLLEEVARRHPELSRPSVNRVNLLLRTGQTSLAMHEMELVLERHPTDPLVHLTMAHAYNLVGELEKCRLHIDRALQLKSDYFDAWMLLGQLLEKQHDPPRALEAYERALSIEPQRREAVSSAVRLRKSILKSL